MDNALLHFNSKDYMVRLSNSGNVINDQDRQGKPIDLKTDLKETIVMYDSLRRQQFTIGSIALAVVIESISLGLVIIPILTPTVELTK